VQVALTADGLDAAAEQGVGLRQIAAALGARPNLVEDIDDTTRAVTGPAGDRLVTVWLTEGPDGVWELVTAFEAGMATELRWEHIFGGSDAT
jgi:hypothetical protein